MSKHTCDKCGSKRTTMFKNPNLEKKWSLNNIDWKQALTPDMPSLIIFIVVMLLLYGYNHDVKQCQNLIKDPCKYCSTAGTVPILGDVKQSPYLLNTSIIEQNNQQKG